MGTISHRDFVRIVSPNDLSIKDPHAFQSLSKSVNEFKHRQSVCLASWRKWLCLICSLTSFKPTEWSQCVPEQPNWVDSAVSCLMCTCMTSSSLTERPASAVLWLSKGIALEWMFKQAATDALMPLTLPNTVPVFAYLLFACKSLQRKPRAEEMCLRVDE